jgi:amidohydrolase
MPLPTAITQVIDAAIEWEADSLFRLARNIHQHPELCFEETKAAAWITELLESRQHGVERGLGGLSTALRARAGQPNGPKVAILAEYDALPGIGHACGHNLIAAGAVGAFLAAAEVAKQAGGEVILLGTPAEEGGGGKIRLLEAGVFEGIDSAMMFHPLDRDLLVHRALASLWITFTFRGIPSHAAAAPHAGKSALTACLDTFRLIDGQRVHFRDGVHVHGYITNGGQAVNIIPELAACEFSVRAPNHAELDRVRLIVERCARGAAIASDVEVRSEVRQGYRAMKNNLTLAHCFGSHLEVLGRRARAVDPRLGAGSTDMGDVSQVIPAIHPYLAIVDEGEAFCHEPRFADAAGSDQGLQTALLAAKALARTAIEVIYDGTLREAIQAEWLAQR